MQLDDGQSTHDGLRATFRIEELVLNTASDAAEAARHDDAALVASLDGHAATFILEIASTPPSTSQAGRIRISASATNVPPGELDVVRDDLEDVLDARRRRFTSKFVAPGGSDVLSPVEPRFVAEILRREESLAANTGAHPTAGFNRPLEESSVRIEPWSLWRLNPHRTTLSGLCEMMMAQSAPVALRVMIRSTRLTGAEQHEVERLAADTAPSRGEHPYLAAAVRSLEALLYQRPLFEFRIALASPQPLGHSLLATVGHTYSPPPADLVNGERGLIGGYATRRFRPEEHDDAVALWNGNLEVSTGPSPAPGGLRRLRRLGDAHELSSAFRFPLAQHTTFPGIPVERVPVLEEPGQTRASQGTVLGTVTADGGQRTVHLDESDRLRHTYIVGQTGTGKSTLMVNMVRQDIEDGLGVAVLDPHGDLVDQILELIPPERIDDVVLVDPADPDAVVGLNLLEAETELQHSYITAELCEFFSVLFDPQNQGIVGPRFHQYIRNCALLILARPDLGGSLLDIPKLLVDRQYLDRYLDGIDGVYKIMLDDFFRKELTMQSQQAGDVVGWVRSKFEGFRLSPNLRKIVGQNKSTISFSDTIAERRILLVDLSKSSMGQFDSALLGFAVISKLWSAALGRGQLAPGERGHFALYIDEFQNFTTASLGPMLAEARKFGLSLTLANQYVSQIPETVRDAILGNVGSKVAFRVGPLDRAILHDWFGDGIEPQHFTSLPNYAAMASLLERGEPSELLVLETLPAPLGSAPNARDARRRSNELYGRNRDVVEAEILAHWTDKPAQRPPDRQTAGVGPRTSSKTTGSTFLDEWLEKKRKQGAANERENDDAETHAASDETVDRTEEEDFDG